MTESTLVPDGTWTVNETLRRHPEAVEVFNRFGIDACCGGDASLDEAARRDGADLGALITALDAIIDQSRPSR